MIDERQNPALSAGRRNEPHSPAGSAKGNTGANLHRPIAAVLSVVVHESKVLLVRRANPPDIGLWGFPGGKIEFGETIEQAAVRELQEETGVVARAIGVFTAVDAIEMGPSDGLGSYHFVLIAVLCRWVSGTPLANDDALDAEWFDIPRLMSTETRKSVAVDTVAKKAVLLAQNYDLNTQ